MAINILRDEEMVPQRTIERLAEIMDERYEKLIDTQSAFREDTIANIDVEAEEIRKNIEDWVGKMEELRGE